MTEDELSASTAAVIERFNAAFNGHDVVGLIAAMTDGHVIENTGPARDGERYQGATSVRVFWGRFFQANPQATFAAEEQSTAGRSVCAALAVRLG